jgi:hypothetical protein
MAAVATTTSSANRVLHTYRVMMRMIQQLPESKAGTFRTELRTKFRVPLSPADELDERLREAGEKIAFLRIITPKAKNDGSSAGRWVYRNGERVEDGDTTRVDGKGVINNFTGHNLDPCMVKRHNAGLRRAGFVNNLHAKGIF